MIRFLDMREQLKRRQYPCLCLFGNDGWVRRKAVANVCDSLNVPNDGFSVDYLDNPSFEDIKLACMTQALFCDVKVVVCENFVFPQGIKQIALKKEISTLIGLWDGSFCLVFVSDSDKNFDIDGIEKINCNKLDRDSICKWIIGYCKRQQVTIECNVADRLAQYCLNDMDRISIETQKLIDSGEVSLDSIEQLVHKDAEYIVYDLSQVIAKKNVSRALELYKGLISRGEEPRALFGLLYNFYRRAYYVKTSVCSGEDLAGLLGVKPAAIEFAKQAASRYKPMQLKKALEYFEQADNQIKAFLDENEVMTVLIMQLTAM